MNLEIGNQFYFFNKSYPNLRVQRRQGAINKCPKGAIHKRQLSYYSIFIFYIKLELYRGGLSDTVDPNCKGFLLH